MEKSRMEGEEKAVTRFLMETQKAYMSWKMDTTIVPIHFDQSATDHMHGASSK